MFRSNLSEAILEVTERCSESSLLTILKLHEDLEETKRENLHLQELLSKQVQTKVISLESNRAAVQRFLSNGDASSTKGSNPLLNGLLQKVDTKIKQLKETKPMNRESTSYAVAKSEAPLLIKAQRLMTTETMASELERELREVKMANVPEIQVCPTLMTKTIHEMAYSASGEASIAIQITNHLSEPLTNEKRIQRLDSHIQSDCDLPAPLSTIAGRSRECLLFSTEGSALSLLVSYHIGLTEMMLLTCFEVLPDGRSYVALAFAPTYIKVNQGLLRHVWGLKMSRSWKEGYEISRPDRKRSGNVIEGWGGHLTVSSGPLRAKAKLTTGPKACLKVNVWRKHQDVIEKEGVEIEAQEIQIRELISSNYTLADFVTAKLALGSNEPCGCLVEIQNGLVVCLEKPLLFLASETKLVRNPDEVSPFARSCFAMSNSTNAKCLVTYPIASTDIVLSIFLCVTPTENTFSLAFLPANVDTDENLMNYVSGSNQWKTRPDLKLAKATDGEQTVEMRNMRMKARMTVGPKSVLEVFVTAL